MYAPNGAFCGVKQANGSRRKVPKARKGITTTSSGAICKETVRVEKSPKPERALRHSPLTVTVNTERTT